MVKAAKIVLFVTDKFCVDNKTQANKTLSDMFVDKDEWRATYNLINCKKKKNYMQWLSVDAIDA